MQRVKIARQLFGARRRVRHTRSRIAELGDDFRGIALQKGSAQRASARHRDVEPAASACGSRQLRRRMSGDARSPSEIEVRKVGAAETEWHQRRRARSGVGSAIREPRRGPASGPPAAAETRQGLALSRLAQVINPRISSRTPAGSGDPCDVFRRETQSPRGKPGARRAGAAHKLARPKSRSHRRVAQRRGFDRSPALRAGDKAAVGRGGARCSERRQRGRSSS